MSINTAERAGLAQAAIAALVRRLGDPVAEVADASLAALLAYGPAALPQVVAACDDTDNDRAVRALSWLARSPEFVLRSQPALAALVDALEDGEAVIRAEAASSLGELLRQREHLTIDKDIFDPAPQLGLGIERLCTACADHDPLVREAAARGLGHTPWANVVLLDALRSTLNDNSSRAVREAAARSLGLLAGKFA